MNNFSLCYEDIMHIENEVVEITILDRKEKLQEFNRNLRDSKTILKSGNKNLVYGINEQRRRKCLQQGEKKIQN